MIDIPLNLYQCKPINFIFTIGKNSCFPQIFNTTNEFGAYFFSSWFTNSPNDLIHIGMPANMHSFFYSNPIITLDGCRDVSHVSMSGYPCEEWEKDYTLDECVGDQPLTKR